MLSHLVLGEKEYEITTLVRDKSASEKLEPLGVKTVIGTLDDSALLEKAAEDSDVVIHTADASDHVGSCVALTTGAKKRGQKGGMKPIYIHTGGTGVLMDSASGQFASDKVYDDSVFEDTHSNIPDSAWHRNVDNLVYEAGKSGLVDTFIICPPLIYGTSSGPVRQDSRQVPGLIRLAIARGKAAYVGKGLNIWNNVHVEDLADLYVLIMEKALEGVAPKNDEGYYFAESSSSNFKDLVEQIAKVLLRLGVTKDDTTEGVDTSTSDIFPKSLAYATGNNSRSRAVKGRNLGWNPHRPSLCDTLEETTQRILQGVAIAPVTH